MVPPALELERLALRYRYLQQHSHRVTPPRLGFRTDPGMAHTFELHGYDTLLVASLDSDNAIFITSRTNCYSYDGPRRQHLVLRPPPPPQNNSKKGAKVPKRKLCETEDSLARQLKADVDNRKMAKLALAREKSC